MSEPSARRRKITIQDLRGMKSRGERIVAMGVYDAVMASLADEAGVHVMMTGPSGPMSLFGHTNPTQITFEEQLVTLKAVTRVARFALINAHLPYLSYHASARDAVLSAARVVIEGQAETVKCDANRELASNIRAIVASGIPVIAHIGLQASRKVEQSGYGLKGQTAEEARRIVDDACALVDAGVFAFVVENVTSDLMGHLTEKLPVPTISLGSGGNADGVCIISGDAVNYSVFSRPRHAGQFADLRAEIDRALRAYAQCVRQEAYPSGADAMHMTAEEHAAFLAQVARVAKP
ncbi:MAG: 3-methyl-2-oxobutanoate hydroxymethyltransferase [Hyphomonadaceae bacterium]|nr:3-methyl-2-oxobutanoate hydroxymethyltransferase [Hyphomonadaceae bacterium]